MDATLLMVSVEAAKVAGIRSGPDVPGASRSSGGPFFSICLAQSRSDSAFRRSSGQLGRRAAAL